MPRHSLAHRAARRLTGALSALLVAAITVAAPAKLHAQGNILEPSVPLAGLVLLVPHADTTATPERAQNATATRSSRLFYGVLFAGAALSFQYSVDPDAGGYEDKWNTMAAFPDKGVHALASFALTTVGVDLGAKPWIAAASVCAAGAAFEASQGYVSKIDIAADCVGAAGAALWRTWRDRDRPHGR